MAAEHVLNLLDSYWFETTILTNKTPSKFHPISQTKVVEVLPVDTTLDHPTLEVRSYSDQTLCSTACVFSDSPIPSPDSVLTLQKLRTIPSGSEVREFAVESKGNHDTQKKLSFSHRRRGSRLIRKGKSKTSMSLSELEFKELKGFMDLGFVFSEEDKDSGLVSLIPGLQRLGREGDEQQKNIDQTLKSEPYLSEAWGVLDQRKEGNPLSNWRVPVHGNEIDMKHSLRFWAQTVASIVR